jgi:hypothetical protein
VEYGGAYELRGATGGDAQTARQAAEMATGGGLISPSTIPWGTTEYAT